MRIAFNKPFLTGEEEKYLKQVINSGNFSGDNYFRNKCVKFLQDYTRAKKVYITTSCTKSLEMCASILNLKPEDEVIMPSFSYVSTANAFALQGAKIVFVDIRPDTMNIDENKIEDAITEKTKAIVVMHYGGISCDMDKILALARKYNLYVIEDAAHCIGSKYKGRNLGTLGDFGCYSFHETKNIHCGEGGALFVNREEFLDKVEIFYNKGTDRKLFLKGLVDYYSWKGLGSNCTPPEIVSAFLYCQLTNLDKVLEKRLKLWNIYYEYLYPLKKKGIIELPFVPEYCKHNAHIFFIKVEDYNQRSKLIEFLRKKEVESTFHYIPLHTSEAGQKYGRFHGEDEYTTKESQRLLRLPMHYYLSAKDIEFIVSKVYEFFQS